MTTTEPQAPLHPDRWLVPGSQTLYVLMPELYLAHELGERTEQETTAAIERRVLAIVTGAMTDMGVRDRTLVDDLTQALHERIATMNAGERYDPTQTTPTSYLFGIARFLIREQLWRRERPSTIPSEAIECIPVRGNQLERAARAEILEELKGWLDELSPGEIRALVRECGPIFDYSPPIGRPRRLKNHDALPQALTLLQHLSGAHQSEQ